MKFSTLALALGTAVFVSAQDITSLPQCAQQPILQAITDSGCPLTDVSCICKNEKFVKGLLAKIPQDCTPQEVLVTAQTCIQLCAAYGVDITVSLASTTVVGATETDASTEPTTSVISTTTSEVSSTGTSTPTGSETPANTESAAPAATNTPSAGQRTELDGGMWGAMAFLGFAGLWMV